MRKMEDGVFYNLNPPAIVGGKRFHRVQCDWQDTDNLNEYTVRGIPEGGVAEELFVLRFAGKGEVQASRSENQSSLRLRR